MTADCVQCLIHGRRASRLDQCYSWAVLCASFLSHAMHLGFSMGIMGNITVMHMRLFDIDLKSSAWLGSVHMCVLFCFAPVASILIEKVSCRFTQIFGGISLILGIGLSALSTEPYHAYILYSLLSGWGVSATYMATSAILAQYFDRHKYLSFALAVLGYYVGMTFWPVLSQLLFRELGYSYAMAVMSSAHVVHIVSGLLFVDNVPPLKDDDSESSVKKNEIESKSEVSVDDILPQEKLKEEDQDIGKMNLLMNAKALLSDWKIWCLLLNCFLWELNVGAFLVIVNDFMHHYGNMSDEQAATGITIIGALNIVGCLLVMATSSLTYDRTRLHFSCSMTFAIATIVIPFTDGVTIYYSMAAVWGLAQGALIANLLAVVYNFCKVDQLTLLFGVELLSEGVGGLIGAPLCGFVQQTVGPKTGFFVAGAAGILGSICIIPVIIYNHKQRQLAERDTLKALVIGLAGNAEQKRVIQEIEEAASPDYPHLHMPHSHHDHHQGNFNQHRNDDKDPNDDGETRMYQNETETKGKTEGINHTDVDIKESHDNPAFENDSTDDC